MLKKFIDAGGITMSWKDILKEEEINEKEYVMISRPYENYSNQKEIEVYWGYGDGGEGETIATFTDKDRDDVYDWVENWLKKNGYKNIDIEYE
jgi:hypothetical protein|tara:strand:- start:303 stop:581 length:279 start_codon:yes stop_codon:yes gene_type:complete